MVFDRSDCARDGADVSRADLTGPRVDGYRHGSGDKNERHKVAWIEIQTRLNEHTQRGVVAPSRQRFHWHCALDKIAGETPAPPRDFVPHARIVVSSARLPLLENLTRNYHALDFAGAFADGAEFGVAIKFLYRVVLHEAVASKNLHRFVGDAHADFAGVEFRHAGFLREARAFLIGKPRRVIHEQAGGFDLRGHVGELELNGLKFTNGLPKLLALFRILH